jgi:glycosyltransferase involved in cell wall biosynthesis
MKLRLPISQGPKPPGDVAARLKLSPLFDARFYQRALEARGLSPEGREPIAHYVSEGEAAGVPPSLLFDPAFYAERNPDVAKAGIGLLRHYVEHGAAEGRDPHPLVDLALIRSQLAPGFSGDPLVAYLQSHGGQLRPHALVDPAYLEAEQRRRDLSDDRPALVFYLESDADAVNPSADFDGFGYRRLYPDSAGMNPLVHYARIGAAKGYVPPRDRGPLGRAAAQIEAAARLDPDVLKTFEDPAATPLLRGYDIARREFRLWRRLAKATGRRAHRHVILVPWLKRGGADRAALLLARALLESDGQARVLIVCTQDDAVEALDWAPVTQRLSVARVASDIDDRHDTCAAFCNFLRLVGCRHLYVVNSRFGWELIERYGATLKPMMRLYGFAFCQDYAANGRRAGYAWTHLGQAIDALDALVSDNSRTIHEFARDLALDAQDLAKFVCLPLPADERLDGAAAQVERNLRGLGGRPRVFWAGRYGAQKGLDIAAEVALALPGIEVRAYGGDEAPAPLVAGGAYADFADLPLHEAALFLHTARWEGLPNVLLEAGAAGLPIVASDVGGVGDLVDAATGWLVPPAEGAEGLARAVREVLARPDEALARARAMRARIAERHSWAAFLPAVAGLTGAAHG